MKSIILIILILLLFLFPSSLSFKDSCDTGFNVKSFGAIGDGISLDSIAIQAAIQAATLCPQGSKVILSQLPFPSPSVYLSGPIFLESNVNFYIDKGATLQAATNLSLWTSALKPSLWQPTTLGFINGGRCLSNNTAGTNCTFWHNLKNVTLSGNGIIDGSGSAWWGMSTWWPNTILPKPFMLELALIDGLHIIGLTLAHSAHWTIVPILSKNILIEEIFLDAGIDRMVYPYNGYNIDGLDSNNVINMTLRNSILHSGDDCIALNSRGVDASAGDFPSENITIGPNVTCITPISIGSGTGIGIYNVTIRDSIIDARWGIESPEWRPRWYKTALRFKTARGRGPAGVANVFVTNITAIGVDLFVDSQPFYSCQNSSGTINWKFCVENAQPPPQLPSEAPAYVNISFQSLQGDAWRFAWLEGLPEHPGYNWTFDDINVDTIQNEWVCDNIEGSTGGNVRPPSGDCFVGKG
jgi:polygalacturonase